MPSVKLSICVPVYNSAPFLAETLDSILAQNYKEFELIIADDASTDGSAAIVAGYAKRDPRIKVVMNRQNRGMVANWNHCLQMSQGEYIRFVLGDDLLTTPDSLGAMTNILDSDQTVALVSSSKRIIDADSRPISSVSSFRNGCHDGREVIRFCLESARNLIGEPSVVMFRRDSIEGGFNPGYRQLVDLEMWFRLLRAGRFYYLAEPLSAFRRHANQQTAVNVRNLVHIDEMLELCKWYGDDLPGLARWYLERHQLARMWRQYRQSAISRPELEEWLTRRIGPHRFRWLDLPLYRCMNPFWKGYVFLKTLQFAPGTGDE